MAKKEKQSGFKAFLQSKKYKTIMGFVYGWGASVVMIGAYFKLTHIPGADIMLGIGLGVEAFIFFLSAFEPPHMDYEWENVFVELEENWDGEQKTVFGVEGNVAGGNQKKLDEKALEEMFNKMNVSDETFNRIGRGLDKLAENANGIAEISNAVSATSGYTNAMERATKALSSLGNFDLTGLDSDVLKKMAGNMSSLNAIYEMQLQSANQSADVSRKMAETVNKYVNNLNESVDNTNKLNQQMSQLSSRISSLNSVYGGMLSAMNIKA